ncbi:MAG: ATP-binding protein [Micrococcales bacterium]|nr:ATP-binding protein [Micrococcales bacterium]
MNDATGLVRRRILDVATERCTESPVLLLEGPRTVGKSTLLRLLADQVGGRILDLDDLDTRSAVGRDPVTMIDGPGLVLIDEYQHVPLLLDAIKARLNTSSRPCQFVLTGSARHESLPRTAQALTGRLQRLPVLPLSQSEIEGTRPELLHRLVTEPADTIPAAPSSTTREDYISRITLGGFPLALAAPTDRARGRWIDGYVQLTLERDVQTLSRLRQARVLPAVLERLAGQTAQVLNSARLADGLGIDDKTARDYVRLLEAVFLARLLPAWDRTLTRRTTARPKVHMVDTGVSARLLRLTSEKLARRDPTTLSELGHPMETFVVGELLKEASWTDEIVAAGHWRAKDDYEVDLVLETDDGRVVAFEIKTSARVSGTDLRGLARLRDLLGDAFVAGVALYTGARSYTYDDRLHVLPIDRLWREQR